MKVLICRPLGVACLALFLSSVIACAPKTATMANAAGAPPVADRTAIHLIGRATFGPRPGDLAHVQAIAHAFGYTTA